MRRAFTWILFLAGMVACGGDSTDPRLPPAPVPGTLTVTLESPNVDAAMIVELTGPDAMTGLATVAGVTLYSRPQASAIRAALFGSLRAGVVLTFSVPDVAAAAEYTAHVVEAADSTNALRSSVDAYRLVVTP